MEVESEIRSIRRTVPSHCKSNNSVVTYNNKVANSPFTCEAMEFQASQAKVLGSRKVEKLKQVTVLQAEKKSSTTFTETSAEAKSDEVQLLQSNNQCDTERIYEELDTKAISGTNFSNISTANTLKISKQFAKGEGSVATHQLEGTSKPFYRSQLHVEPKTVDCCSKISSTTISKVNSVTQCTPSCETCSTQHKDNCRKRYNSCASLKNAIPFAFPTPYNTLNGCNSFPEIKKLQQNVSKSSPRASANSSKASIHKKLMDQKDANLSRPISYIHTFVRLRPLNELEKGEDTVLTVRNNCCISLPWKANSGKELMFSVDHVFPPDAAQSEIWQSVGSCVENLLNGFSCTIFAHGQTGTGKTFTMLGPEIMQVASGCELPESKNSEAMFYNPEKNSGQSLFLQKKRSPTFVKKAKLQLELAISNIESILHSEQRGIIPRACKEIFTCIHQKYGYKNGSVKVFVSYVQLYNEKLLDLLKPHGEESEALSIVKDPKCETSVIVQGLQTFQVESCQEMLQLLFEGTFNRALRSTKQNDMSSRSHTIFQIEIRQYLNQDMEFYKSSHLNLVDLAGNEKCKPASHPGRTHAAEMGAINRSLSTLGLCIAQLSKKDSLVSYRNSNLTRLLQESLGGNCFTLFICTLSPSILCLRESLTTLRLAVKAKSVRNFEQFCQKANVTRQLHSLRKEVRLLRTLLKSTGIKKEEDESEKSSSRQALLDAPDHSLTNELRSRSAPVEPEDAATDLFHSNRKNLLWQSTHSPQYIKIETGAKPNKKKGADSTLQKQGIKPQKPLNNTKKFSRAKERQNSQNSVSRKVVQERKQSATAYLHMPSNTEGSNRKENNKSENRVSYLRNPQNGISLAELPRALKWRYVPRETRKQIKAASLICGRSKNSSQSERVNGEKDKKVSINEPYYKLYSVSTDLGSSDGEASCITNYESHIMSRKGKMPVGNSIQTERREKSESAINAKGNGDATKFRGYTQSSDDIYSPNRDSSHSIADTDSASTNFNVPAISPNMAKPMAYPVPYVFPSKGMGVAHSRTASSSANFLQSPHYFAKNCQYYPEVDIGATNLLHKANGSKSYTNSFINPFMFPNNQRIQHLRHQIQPKPQLFSPFSKRIQSNSISPRNYHNSGATVVPLYPTNTPDVHEAFQKALHQSSSAKKHPVLMQNAFSFVGSPEYSVSTGFNFYPNFEQPTNYSSMQYPHSLLSQQKDRGQYSGSDYNPELYVYQGSPKLITPGSASYFKRGDTAYRRFNNAREVNYSNRYL